MSISDEIRLYLTASTSGSWFLEQPLHPTPVHLKSTLAIHQHAAIDTEIDHLEPRAILIIDGRRRQILRKAVNTIGRVSHFPRPYPFEFVFLKVIRSSFGRVRQFCVVAKQSARVFLQIY